jgi:Domain of unknown function (DUF4157)
VERRQIGTRSNSLKGGRAAWLSRDLAITLTALIGLGFSAETPACFPCIKVPAVRIGGHQITPPVTVTPVGVAPTVVVNKVDHTVNQTADTVKPAVAATGSAVKAVAGAAVAPQVQIVRVIAGKETLGAAGKNVVHGDGNAIASVGTAVSEANAAANQLKIVAAGDIAGDVGKTTMTIITGGDRLSVDFAATAAIEAGGIVAGKLNLEDAVAEPLAAALRSAQLQFLPQSNPIPADIKAKFAAFYPADVLNNARWTVGSVSISVPDLLNQGRKIFQNVENAVTVGNVTVFVTDPAGNLHWWAHELQHQVQYHEWGIDHFAFEYVTSCHSVETEAEQKAIAVAPIQGTISLAC